VIAVQNFRGERYHPDMSTQGIPVHDEHLFTLGKFAGKTVLISEVNTLAPEGGDRGPWRWASFTTLGPIKGQSRFRLRHAATGTTSDFVFEREASTDVGKRCEFSGPDGWRAHVYLQ